MTKHLLIFAAALFAVGCDSDKESGGTGTDTDTTAEASYAVSWGGSSVDLSITDGDSAASYWFGLAETGCGDPDNCWYGEDCVYGDLTGNYFYCHPASTSGVSLSYGGDFSALSEGSETVFGDSSFDGTVTYYVEDSSSGACWAWGHDSSYYAGLGCN